MKPHSAGPLLPFSWARQHGVLAVDGQHGIQIYCHPDTSHAALMEAYRCLPGEPALARLEAEALINGWWRTTSRKAARRRK